MYIQPINNYDWRIWYLPQSIHVSTAPPMTFFARKAISKVKVAEESLLGFTQSELDEMNKKSDTDLDSDLYYMKKKLGRIPGPGEYVIRVSSVRDDVRIVRTLAEKKRWGSEIMDGGIPLIRPYTVIKDPDGIHAQVVLNEACVLVVRCQYCRKLMLLNDVAERGQEILLL